MKGLLKLPCKDCLDKWSAYIVQSDHFPQTAITLTADIIIKKGL